MKFEVPNWLIIVGAIGMMFTAIIYPYIRHVVFDWYNDIQEIETSKPGNRKNIWTIYTRTEFLVWTYFNSFHEGVKK